MKRDVMILAAALVTCGATMSGAQGPAAPTPTKVERKNRVPVNNDVLRVTLPKAIEATLSNGLTVLILEDHRLPRVSLQYTVGGAGPIHEPANLPGLANITAQLMREGTKTRTSAEFASAAEGLGATLTVGAAFGSEAALLTASGLSDQFDQWFALANEALLDPAFRADELAKLKERLRANLRQQRSTSAFLSAERFGAALYGRHPAAVVSATAAAIDAMTPDMLATWHRERYTPQNTILGIAGDVNPSDLLAKLGTRLGAWRKTDLKEALPEDPTPARGRKVLLVDRPGSVQTSITLGNIAIDRRHSDYVHLVVANSVTGATQSGRLYVNLRQEKGYTYAVTSGFTALKYAGPWRAAAEVRTEVTDGAMTEFFREIQRLSDELVPDSELDERKRAIVANFALSLEDPQQVLGYAITRKLYGFPADYWETYPEKIIATTAADVQRVARKYIDPANIQVVAVGEASRIKPILEKYGPVETHDLEGRKIGN